jgi:hypothetical protein
MEQLIIPSTVAAVIVLAVLGYSCIFRPVRVQQWCQRQPTSKFLPFANLVFKSWYPTYLRFMGVFAWVFAMFFTYAAYSRVASQLAERPLIGTYHLVHPTSCGGDIQDSTLAIRDDGTYDQHVQLKNGRDEIVANGHWTYDTTARRINFSKFLISAETSFLAEASHPAVIIVNRSADCWYQHPK